LPAVTRFGIIRIVTAPPTTASVDRDAVIDLSIPDVVQRLETPEAAVLAPDERPNETVYARLTPESTRVGKWPNAPWIRETQPDHYFEIFTDDFFSTTHRFVTSETPIGSIGSCFATRIAHQLQLWGYNYVLEEDDLPPGTPLAELASTTYRTAPARCGTLFDTPGMRQVVERAFGLWSPPRVIARTRDGRIVDPFRTVTQSFRTAEEYEADRERHTDALRRALLKCEVMILTLGLTEAWQFTPTGDFVSLPQLARAPGLFRRRRLSVDENLAELERLLTVYRRHRPDIRLIVSVSPVPLNKTFSRDHIVVANCFSKAVLRVVAEEFVARHPGVAYYFPAYEAVTYGTRQAWEDDMRHVSPAAVARVMRLFQKVFLADQAPLPLAPHAPAFPRPRLPRVRRAALRALTWWRSRTMNRGE
jgi:GSCFA family protein